MRNPFRFTVKPGTNELWIGDVGWADWEEINRLENPLSSMVANFGWPCYEGAARQPGYDAANSPLCETSSATDVGTDQPVFCTNHACLSSRLRRVRPVVRRCREPLSIPLLGVVSCRYNGALFFADYFRDCIWAMRVGAGGLPDPADIVTIKANPGDPREGPVQLVAGPAATSSTSATTTTSCHRIVFNPGNKAPTAKVPASPIAGVFPLTVNFSAAGSSDPRPDAHSAWDLDGDGAFDDGTGQTAQFTYVGDTP